MERSRPTGPLIFWCTAVTALPAIQLNWLARHIRDVDDGEAALRLGLAFLFSPLVFLLLRRGLRTLVARLPLSEGTRLRYNTYHNTTYASWWLLFIGAFGAEMNSGKTLGVALVFVLSQAALLLSTARADAQGRLAGLFFVSGMAALIYQIVWQRVLFSFFGVNIESVTIIVAIFMLGLGVGAVAGGALSRSSKAGLPLLFLICEVCIGGFGLISLPLMRSVSEAMILAGTLKMALVAGALLALPTILMGATLPILVQQLHHHYQHVGRSVGTLYFANTLGSAVACFATTHLLFVVTGLQGATFFAAGLNLVVGVAVFRLIRSQGTATSAGVEASP